MKPISLLPVIALAVAAPLAAQEGGVVTVQAPGLESLELGGQLRARWESRDPSPPFEGAESMSRGSGRFRIYADAAFEGGSGRLELQRTVSSDGVMSDGYLRQGFLVLDQQLGMDWQVGRFAMKYGNQRMISDLDWSMVGRAWDGLRVMRDGEGYSADLFWTRAVQGMATGATVEETFGGAYLEFQAGPLDLDAYALARRNDVDMVSDLTLGALVDGATGPVMWSAELAIQTGDHGVDDAAGTALALRADMDVVDGWRTGLGYELASGDDSPGDGDDDAFRPLYDFGHAYHGHQDLFSWTNLQDIVWRNTFPDMCEGWSLHADLHLLAMAEEGGALPTTFGGTAVAGEDDLGTEIDLYAKGRLTPWLKVWTGISFWSAGDAVANADDQTWFFIDLVAEF